VDLLFHKALETQLAQALVGSFKPLGQLSDMLLIVLPLVSFIRFTKHGEMGSMQLFEGIFSDIPVTIDSSLQPPCP
jgi:hypothetical protein